MVRAILDVISNIIRMLINDSPPSACIEVVRVCEGTALEPED